MIVRHFVLRLALMTGTVVWASGWSLAQNAEQPEAGLSGIFPNQAPAGLTFGELEALADKMEPLSPEWRDWVKGTDELLLKLYKDRTPAVAEQRATVDALRKKTNALETALADAKYVKIHRLLLDLRGALVPRVDLAEAVLDLDANPAVVADKGQVRRLLAGIISALDGFVAKPTAAGEQQVRTLTRELRTLVGEPADAFVGVIEKHLENSNMLVVISEGLMNRLFAEDRKESSGIRDRIMEACVVGYQCTNSSLTMDLKPCDHSAWINLVVCGDIYSNTKGYTDQATVKSLGFHSFCATKTVFFDGEQYSTQPTRSSARPNVKTVGAVTRFTKIPIVGKVADKIAYQQAVQRTPQVNYITAGKINSRVRRELNKEADDQFAEANANLQEKRYAPLRKYGMYPQESHVSSTEVEMSIISRLMDDGQIGGSLNPPMLGLPEAGAVAQIHESLLSNGFEGIGLAGQTLSAPEIRQLLDERFTEILGRDIDLPEPSAAEANSRDVKFGFPKSKPVWFSFDNGTLSLTVFASLILEDGSEIPTRMITIPFALELVDDKIVFTRGNISVVVPEKIEGETALEAQIRNRRVRQAFEQQFEQSRTEDAKFEMEIDDRKVELRITSLAAHGGWLTLTLE